MNYRFASLSNDFHLNWRTARNLETIAAPSNSIRRPIGNVLSQIYLGVMALLVIGLPIWLALRDVLRRDDALAVYLNTWQPLGLLWLATPLLAALAFGVGATLGPVGGSPHLLSLLANSPLDRQAAFGVRLIRTGWVLLGFLAGGTMLVWTLLPNPAAISLAISLLGAGASALVVLLAWLLGGLVRPVWARSVSTLVVGGLIWLILSSSAPVALNPVLLLVGCALLIPLIIWLIWRALARLDAKQVVGAAQRWQRAAAGATTGDLGAAGRTFTVPTGIGRKFPLPARVRWLGLTTWLDLLTLWRSPWRVAWIIGLESLAIYLLVLSFRDYSAGVIVYPGEVLSAGLGLLVGGAAIAQYLALACFGERIRFAIDQTMPPQLLGGSKTRIIATRLIMPTLVHLLFAGVAIALAAVWFEVSIWPTMMWLLILTPCLLLLLTYNSLKAQPPLLVLTPNNTPLGDFGAVTLLLWQLDFLVLAGIAGLLSWGLITNPTILGVLLLAGLVGYLALGISRRYRRY